MRRRAAFWGPTYGHCFVFERPMRQGTTYDERGLVREGQAEVEQVKVPRAIFLNACYQPLIFFGRPATLYNVGCHLRKPALATVLVRASRNMFRNGMPLRWVRSIRILCIGRESES